MNAQFYNTDCNSFKANKPRTVGKMPEINLFLSLSLSNAAPSLPNTCSQPNTSWYSISMVTKVKPQNQYHPHHYCSTTHQNPSSDVHPSQAPPNSGHGTQKREFYLTFQVAPHCSQNGERPLKMKTHLGRWCVLQGV